MPVTPQPGRRPLDAGSEARALALLVGAYVLLAWIIPPVYEVPQNDDWAYLATMQQWAETGHLSHLGWNDPTLVFQLFWGRGFAALFGLSYTTLRISTLVLSLVGVLSLFGILRWSGASRWLSSVAALLLLVNPLHLILSYSFNTDVPYLGLATLATFLFLLALERSRWWLFLAAGTVSAAAFLIRQPGILIPAVVCGFVLIGRESRGRRVAFAAASLIPSLIALRLHGAWMSGQTPASFLERAANLHPFFRQFRAAQLPDLLGGASLSATATVITLGLLLVPLLLAVTLARPRELLASPRARWTALAGLTLLGLASWAWISRQTGPWPGWPYLGNYLTRGGALPRSGVAEVGPGWAWNVLTLAGPFLGAWLLAVWADALERPRAGLRAFAPTLVFSLGVAQILPGFIQIEFYDRYLLALLPGALVLASSWAREQQRPRAAAIVALALFAIVSVEYARSYVARSRAAWSVAEALVEQGAPPEQLRLGFEWEGAHLYLEALDRFDHGARFDFQRGFPWDPLLDPRYEIREFAVSPPGPVASYRPFLGLSPRFVGAVGLAEPDPATP